MEEIKTVFKEYRRKLATEGFLKALLWGAIIGFSVNLIAVAVLFITDTDFVWVSVVASLAIVAAVTAIMYFVKYRPTTVSIAERIDSLGLKERLITMTELENDTSYIAMRQREDAREALRRFRKSNLKLSVAVKGIVAAAVVTVLSAAITTYTSMSMVGAAPSFDELVPEDNHSAYVEVIYEAGEGGFISGEMYQMVEEGGTASEVIATADDGYIFECWSDGITTPSRMDTNVFSAMKVTAKFKALPEMTDNSSPHDNMDGNMDMEGDVDMPGANGAIGKYEEYNQVIDGNTYYRDVYQKYFDSALAQWEAGGEVSEGMKAIIEAYYGVIL